VERPALQQRNVEVDGVSIRLLEGGKRDAPAAVFLHGAENWSAFEAVMHLLASDTHVVALALPETGTSQASPGSRSKRALANDVHGVIHALGLEPVTLIGQDAGGQVVHAYVHAYPDELRQAVIMSVAVPGVDPWDEQDNRAHRGDAVQTPVLYLRAGDDSGVDLDRCVQRLRDGGLRDVQAALIPKSGQLAADPQPAALAAALRAFIHPEVAQRGWHTA
jgi:alpha-beta hydrolase superfamily lysophospholipase